ncbi:MAG TPA: class I SAM-dependent methyltransferase [Actinomycetota bacterium]|nr:class I SAM-dependent methyltransferase [Actinomycetota bacterium]
MERSTWTWANARHVVALLRQGRNPAATVYESIGTDFFLALAPGWLNLGLWEGDGDLEEAPVAAQRLVETLAAQLPKGGVVLDVGNGLGVQDPVIAGVARPRRLVALNITESQLRAGGPELERAGAAGVVGDACRIPLADGSVDGVISVEAAFHFRSRAAFFEEVRRVLRPGGVLTMSDVATARLPRTPGETLAGLTQIRVWGLRRGSVASPARIASLARRAGLDDVTVGVVGDRVIAPALAFARRRLSDGRSRGMPASLRLAAAAMLRAVELLWRRGIVEYVLLRASAPN